MVRNYQKKPGARFYKPYTEEQLKQCLIEVLEGKLSQAAASRKYNIPLRTINNRYKGRHGQNIGSPTRLTPAEEKELIVTIITCGVWNYPISSLDVRFMVKHYLETIDKTIPSFQDGVLPGEEWMHSFLRRHKKEISQRNCNHINRNRGSLDPQEFEEYFANLDKTCEGIPPERIFNYDETNVSDNAGRKRLLFRRGTKYPVRVENFSKYATTVIFCCSASGVLLPPYIIYKAEHVYDQWCRNGPKGAPRCSEECCKEGACYNRTKSGWIEFVWM